MTVVLRRSDLRITAGFRYLDYLNKLACEDPLLKTEDFPDQKRAPLTPNSSIYNRNPFSQAGGRRMESRLPLYLLSEPQTPASVVPTFVPTASLMKKRRFPATNQKVLRELIRVRLRRAPKRRANMAQTCQ